MSVQGLGRVKTKSDLVVMPSGRQIFAFFYSPRDRRAQNSGCGYTAQSFYTARVAFGLTHRSKEMICAIRLVSGHLHGEDLKGNALALQSISPPTSGLS
jgi:hypothetical protein